ncbi:PREDICTED: pleckstrin homology domain-containing family A member 4-like [Pseudopodoces humilis]|uniref:pleckstrin homology domain-containing family A member 4-like n=1 Tax=Pseudopodoces humilis TaxID=181119 RepID=UPI000395C392|nr:PREDICTED: pleckstrin homology domain-containing family A member 4-like [Pseudopodoces humilis]
MAESDDPARRDPAPAGPRTQPCRPVPRVHAFGKGEQALRRDPRTPPAMQGWLHKQDSSGLRLWKRRWFVLVDLCLYYYRDSSEQQVRGGLPLPGYEIRVLPPAPRAPRAPQFLFTAEHPGMRTYCLGAETAEELHAWVCALRRGASPLPGSTRSLSQQTLREPRGADPPSPPLPTHSPGEGLGGPPVPPPCCPPVPPLPHTEVPPAHEELPARGCPPRAGDTPEGPRGPPEPAPAGRSPKKPRPPGAAPQPPPERGTSGTNQPPASPAASSDWLSSAAGPAGTAPAPLSNEASRWRWAGAGGRGRALEGVGGRPIRITLLQASF